jgi:Zn finger protein HypA/HybF involved in hydrogenase expression
MREIPLKKRMEVLKLYFEGFPYDEIASKAGIAKGSVVNIIKELRDGKYPEFVSALDILDELRDLAVRMKKNKLDIPQVIIGLKFYERLSFVEPDKLESFIRMCERISPQDFPVEKFVNSAISLCKLEEKLRKPYDEALKDLENELKKKSSILGELKSRVDELERKKQKVERDLEKLEERYMAKREELAELIKGQESLESLGVSKVSKLSSFAKECENLEFNVEKLIELLKLVEERNSLAEEVRFLMDEIDALKKEKERHAKEELKIIENNRKLATASLIIKTQRTAISCASCGSLIHISIPPQSMLYQELRNKAMYAMQCYRCGFVNQISVRDILAAVGYAILTS